MRRACARRRKSRSTFLLVLPSSASNTPFKKMRVRSPAGIICGACVAVCFAACTPAARSPVPRPVPIAETAMPNRGMAAPVQRTAPGRERTSLDRGLRFALGHATDPERDFGHGTGYFSYLAKTGFGDGPASPEFDDRAWRIVDLPHDWAVEAPFDAKAKASHGFKAVGHGFPERSVGWYRRNFFVPESDLGRRLRIEFDGIYRAARVFVNGFLLGEEPSGYLGASYDLSEYLNYGGDNVIAVRVDASEEEGWFYEGAGIYRHTWLLKTDPLHVARYGTWVRSELNAGRRDGPRGHDARERGEAEHRLRRRTLGPRRGWPHPGQGRTCGRHARRRSDRGPLSDTAPERAAPVVAGNASPAQAGDGRAA